MTGCFSSVINCTINKLFVLKVSSFPFGHSPTSFIPRRLPSNLPSQKEFLAGYLLCGSSTHAHALSMTFALVLFTYFIIIAILQIHNSVIVAGHMKHARPPTVGAVDRLKNKNKIKLIIYCDRRYVITRVRK